MSKKILLVNGPNLNLLGTREPEIYGYDTLDDIKGRLESFFHRKGFELVSFQSNHEGYIIDFLHENRDADYIILNPGGLTHTSVCLRDAISGINVPFLEVHISNVHAREPFRQHSYLSEISQGTIMGCGVFGYQMAAELIVHRLSE